MKKRVFINYKNIFILVINIFAIYKLLRFIINEDFDYQFLSTIGLLLAVWLPTILERIVMKRFSTIIHIEYYIFLIISLVIGAIYGNYNRYSAYDTIIHFVSGILISTISISYLAKNEDLKSLKFQTIVSFVFFTSAGIAGLWEIFEFFISRIFDLDIQKVINTGIVNTIKDISAGTLGSVLFINCIYLDNRLLNSKYLNKMTQVYVLNKKVKI